MAATDEECQNQSRFHQFCSTIWVETSSCPCTGHYLELLIKWNLMSRETVKTTGEDYRFSVSRAVHPSIHSQEFNSSQKKKASKSKKEQHPKVSQVQLSMFLLQTIPKMNPLRKQERQTGELLTKWRVFWDVLLLAFVFSYKSPILTEPEPATKDQLCKFQFTHYYCRHIADAIMDNAFESTKMCHFRALFAYPPWFHC